MNIQKEILKTIKYFLFFAYHPTSKEIYTFLQAEINENSFKNELEKMAKQKKILDIRSLILKKQFNTPPQYSIYEDKAKYPSFAKASEGKQISKKKLVNMRYMTYVKLLSIFPQIRLIGLSGSISMMNAMEDDDIDLFIITGRNRLFTGRFIALFLAQLLGLRRNRETQISSNKICLNLFFDESELKIPKFKQTLFVGHEVLQMKPIISKDHVYERFIEANNWVFKIFPNARLVFSIKYEVSSIKNKNYGFSIRNTKYSILDTISDRIELILKKLQLNSINKHRTTELITNTQLWFHPDDFERKLFK